MLTNEDKFWIKEQLDKILKNSPRSSSGTTNPMSSSTSLVPRDYRVPTNYDSSKKEVTSGDPELDRHYALAKKIRKNQETLAERLEYERLTLKLKLDVGRKIKNQVGKVTKNVSNAFEERFGTEGWKDTRKVIGTTASSIGGAAGSLASGVGGAAGSLASGVGGALGQVGSGLSTGARQLAGTLRTDRVMNDAFRVMMYSNPVTAMLMEFSPLLKGVGGAAKSILTGTGKAAGSILKGVSGTFKSISGGIGGAFKSLGGGIGDLASYFYGKNKNKDIKTSKKGIFGEENNILEEKQRIENQNTVGGTNYILAQKAMFIGGKNNVIISTDGLSGMFKMKQDLDNKEGIPLLTTSKKGNQEQKTFTNNYSEIKKDYIDAEVISSTVIKEQVKQEKTNTEKLSKGLNGIKEEVEKSNKFLDVIGKKSLLILLGIGLAATAIVGLVNWFRGNEFVQKLGSVVGKIVKSMVGAAADIGDKVNDVVYAGTSSGVDEKLSTITGSNYSGLKPEAISKLTNELYGGNQTKYIETQFQDKGSFWHGDKIKGMKKAGVLDSATNRLLEDAKHNWANFNASVKKFTTTGEGKKLAFPVPIKILDAEFNKDGTAAVLIERASAGEEINRNITQLHNSQVAKAVAQSPRLVITRVQKILVPTNVVIPPSTSFIIVSKSYQIIGDLSAFMGKNNFTSWQNDSKNQKEADDRYVRFMNQKGIDKDYFYNSTGLQEEYSKSMDKLARKEVVKAGLMSGGHELVHNIMEKGKEWAGSNSNYDPAANTNVREVNSTNVDKVKENAQQITKQQNAQTNKQNNTSNSPSTPSENQNSNKLSMLGGSSIHYAPTIDRDLISPYDIVST